MIPLNPTLPTVSYSAATAATAAASANIYSRGAGRTAAFVAQDAAAASFCLRGGKSGTHHHQSCRRRCRRRISIPTSLSVVVVVAAVAVGQFRPRLRRAPPSRLRNRGAIQVVRRRLRSIAAGKRLTPPLSGRQYSTGTVQAFRATVTVTAIATSAAAA